MTNSRNNTSQPFFFFGRGGGGLPKICLRNPIRSLSLILKMTIAIWITWIFPGKREVFSKNQVFPKKSENDPSLTVQGFSKEMDEGYGEGKYN